MRATDYRRRPNIFLNKKPDFWLMKKLSLIACIALALYGCKSGATSENNADGRATTAAPADNPLQARIPQAQGTPRILFMGNSHTEYFTSLPDNFGELCAASNQPINIDKLVTMMVELNK